MCMTDPWHFKQRQYKNFSDVYNLLAFVVPECDVDRLLKATDSLCFLQKN